MKSHVKRNQGAGAEQATSSKARPNEVPATQADAQNAPKPSKKTAAVSNASNSSHDLAAPQQNKRIDAKRIAKPVTPNVNDSSEGQSEGQATEIMSGPTSNSAKKRKDAGRVRGPYKKTREKMARLEEGETEGC